MSKYTLQTENVDARFDPETGLLYVIYGRIITPHITTTVYEWGTQLMQDIGVEMLRGLIVDFRKVTRFDYKNLRTATQQSRKLNQQFDLSQVPVAHLVNDMYQEQMVRVAVTLSQQPQRMKLVYTDEQAQRFIETFHQQQAAPPNDTIDENNHATPRPATSPQSNG